MHRNAITFFGLVLLAALLHSCSKDVRDPCLQPRNTFLAATATRHADTGVAIIDTALPNPVLIPITNQITKYIYGGVSKVIQLKFTLANDTNFSQWIVRPDSAVSVQDTLRFYYQRQLHFLSNACGYTNFYFLDSVQTTRHTIDSVRLQRQDITTDANVENLIIIFR